MDRTDWEALAGLILTGNRGLRQDMRQDMAQLETRLREDISQLRGDMKQLAERVGRLEHSQAKLEGTRLRGWKDCARPSPCGPPAARSFNQAVFAIGLWRMICASFNFLPSLAAVLLLAAGSPPLQAQDSLSPIPAGARYARSARPDLLLPPSCGGSELANHDHLYQLLLAGGEMPTTEFLSDQGTPLMVSFADKGTVPSRTDVLLPGGSVHHGGDQRGLNALRLRPDGRGHLLRALRWGRPAFCFLCTTAPRITTIAGSGERSAGTAARCDARQKRGPMQRQFRQPGLSLLSCRTGLLP